METQTLGHHPGWLRYGLIYVFLSLIMVWASPSLAIVRSWDDAGGSADKNWSNFGNWSPDGAVGYDNIFIGDLPAATNDTTIYDITTQILTLTLSNGADVETNGNELVVNGLTTLSDLNTMLVVEQNSSGITSDSLDTDALVINSGAFVHLDSGRLEVDTAQVEINAGGTLRGTGFVDLEQPVTGGVQVLENSGTLIAYTSDLLGINAGTLTLDSSSGMIDLDGDSEAGIVTISRNDTLAIIGGNLSSDAFSGTMNLADGANFNPDNAWSLANGNIEVNTGGAFVGTAGAAAEISGAQFTLTSGTITLNTADIDRLRLSAPFVASGGTIANSNEVIFNNTTTINAGVDFQMNGGSASITLMDNATVTINDADFNLDGNEAAGNITTIGNGARLDINHNSVGADDSFGHTINLNGGELDVTNAADTLPWTINSIGVVNAGGAASSNLDGDELDIFGNINVDTDSTLTVNTSGVTFDTGADIAIATGGNFNVNTTSRWESSSVTVTGAGLFQPGSAIIGVDAVDTAAIVWSTDTVNVDDGSLTINPGSSLTITTDAIDNVDNYIGSSITVADTATLTIGLNSGADVNINGVLTYNGNTVSSTFLLAPDSGSAINFASGTMNINGDGGSLARLKFSGSATLNINDALEDFRFEGGTLLAGNTNEISGGTVNGPGELQIGTGHALRGNGTINAQVDGDISAQLIAEGGQLNVTGVLEDIGTLGTSGNSAVLDMALAWNTNVTNTVLLEDGVLQGATITNDGAAGINGRGTVTARIINNTRIGAEGGGTLVIDTTVTATDLDGVSEVGSLNAVSGNLEILGTGLFSPFDGTVLANSGRTVFTNGMALSFASGSSLILNNGTYRSTDSTSIGGAVTVGGGTATLKINGTATLRSTNNTTLNGNLVLDNTITRVEAGAVFSGGSSLINPSGSTLVLLDGADVDVLVENRGTLSLGASAGQTSGLDFEQTAAGVWDLELGGTGINDFDRMTLTGLASLAGILDISLIGGFTPTIGDSFTILLAGSVINEFDTVLGSPGAGLEYDVIYNPGNVTLAVVTASLVGDLNSDGFVGIEDLNIVLSAWNQSVPPGDPLADPSGDGFVGIEDLNYVLGNWNAGTPPSSSAANIPEPASLLLLAVGGSSMFIRSRGWR